MVPVTHAGVIKSLLSTGISYARFPRSTSASPEFPRNGVNPHGAGGQHTPPFASCPSLGEFAWLSEEGKNLSFLSGKLPGSPPPLALFQVLPKHLGLSPPAAIGLHKQKMRSPSKPALSGLCPPAAWYRPCVPPVLPPAALGAVCGARRCLAPGRRASSSHHFPPCVLPVGTRLLTGKGNGESCSGF